MILLRWLFIYNSRNLIDVLDTRFYPSDIGSTTVEILQTYQTKVATRSYIQSTTVEILQTYQTVEPDEEVIDLQQQKSYRRIRQNNNNDNFMIYNSRNLIDVLDSPRQIAFLKSTTVEILQTYQTRKNPQMYRLSTTVEILQTYQTPPPLSIVYIYNSRNLIDVLDMQNYEKQAESTTVEILQTYQTMGRV